MAVGEEGTMIDRLKNCINEYFIGKNEVVENVLICLLAGGHVLLEDVPGVGKTTLVRTLAGAIDLEFGYASLRRGGGLDLQYEDR